MSELQKLVRRFVEGELEYPAFHAEFVQNFLSLRHNDAAMEDLVNIIESACADLDEGDIAIEDLREELSVLAHMPLVSIEMVNPQGVSRMNLPLRRVPIPRRESGGSDAIVLPLAS